MKLITAFIQPIMLDRVTRQLRSSSLQSFAISEARLFGPRADEASPDEQSMRLDIPVEDSQVSRVVELIKHAVEADYQSDFLIFVTDMSTYVLD